MTAAGGGSQEFNWRPRPGSGTMGAVGDVEDYEGLNIQARLTAGLGMIKAWLARYRIEADGGTAVIDHMWQFLTVTPDTFMGWYDWQSEAQLAAERGDALLPSAAAACRRCGASAQDLAAILAGVTGIVYDSLFGALDLDLSMARLRTIAAVAGRCGIAVPDASSFSHLPAQERHGWGNPVSPVQLTELRSHADPGQ